MAAEILMHDPLANPPARPATTAELLAELARRLAAGGVKKSERDEVAEQARIALEAALSGWRGRAVR